MSTRREAAPRDATLEKQGKLLVALLRSGKSEHQRRIVIWGGLRLLATAAVGVFGLTLLALVVPILPRAAGVGLSLLAWAGIAWLVWRHWVRPLRAVPNLAVFARLVEERRDFHDMLRAALEFSERGAPAGGSADLVAQTLERAYEEARRLQLTALFVFPDRRRAGGALLAATAGMLLLGLLAPAAPRRALQGLAFAWPTPASIVYGELEVQGDNRDVLAGEVVVVRVLDHGPLAPEMLLRFNDTGDLWKMRKLQPRGSRVPWAYEFQFEDIRDNTSYRFESGKRHTADYRIHVVQRPIVDHFQLKLVPPSYTQRPSETLEEGRGDAIALFGTRVEIAGQASNGLVEGAIVPEGDPAEARTLSEPL